MASFFIWYWIDVLAIFGAHLSTFMFLIIIVSGESDRDWACDPFDVNEVLSRYEKPSKYCFHLFIFITLHMK